jgi:hypothetical protein
MSRKERFPYSHSVKVRKPHKCDYCNQLIVKGQNARYKNMFDGTKGYIHNVCPPKSNGASTR